MHRQNAIVQPCPLPTSLVPSSPEPRRGAAARSTSIIVVATVVATLAICSPVRAQDVDPALRADIERLLEVTNVASTAARLGSTVANQLIDNMRRQQPQVPARVGEVVREVLDSELKQMFTDPALHDALVRVYAEHFTRADIAALLTFYATDVGRKLIAASPVIAEGSAAAAQRWAAANMPRILGVLQQRLQDEKLVP